MLINQVFLPKGCFILKSKLFWDGKITFIYSFFFFFLHHTPRIISSRRFIQSYKCTNIQVEVPVIYRFMLMILSIIQSSLPLNHAYNSKKHASCPYMYINLCVCPEGTWICFEGSLWEARLHLYPPSVLISLQHASILAKVTLPWGLRAAELPLAPLLPAAPHCGDLRGGRMSDFLFECIWMSVSVCVYDCVWVRVGQASGWLNHTVWALRWMDKTWLRAERALYASTHSLPGLYTLLNPPHKWRGDERRHANAPKDFSHCWRGEEGVRGKAEGETVGEGKKCKTVCMPAHVLECAQRIVKCKHCTQDTEWEGTMNYSEYKWAKIKRDRSWSDSMLTVNIICSSTLAAASWHTRW